MLYSYDKDTDQFIPAGDLGGGGLVGLKGTATAAGDWTITGLTPGKPLFILLHNADSHASVIINSVVSGAHNLWGSTSNSIQLGYLGSDNASNVAVFIPTGTSLTMSLGNVSGSVLAFQ